MSIAILLASYNSSKYLKEQIETIISQTYINWDLYIRDDGSTDNTLDIIHSFVNQDSRIHFVSDEHKGLGAAKSFMKLLEIVHADYYMFSDHDDMWLPNKIEKSYVEMKKIELKASHLPIIVHSDLFVVDKDLKILEKSFWRSSAIIPGVLKTRNFFQVFNFVTGCTMLFNRQVKNHVFPFPSDIPMHDWWITMKVLQHKGIVEEISLPLIYYRQHGGNEVGAREVDANYFIRKIVNIRSTIYIQYQHILFLKGVGGLNILMYYYYKIYYTIIRNR